MPKKDKDNPDQLQFNLFSGEFFVEFPKKQSETVSFQSNVDDIKRSGSDENLEQVIEDNNIRKEVLDLFLPFSYEEILAEVEEGEKKSRLPDLIVPVIKFEEQIIQVLANIKNSGFLLFLYGASGVGKSTFISSLKFQKYIPIKEVLSIKANELEKTAHQGIV